MKKLNSFLVLCFLCSSVILYAQNLEMYVSDAAGGTIKKYSETGMFLNNFVSQGSGSLVNPQDIVFIGDSIAIVSGLNNNRIKKYDATTGEYLGNFSDHNVAGPTRMKIGADNLLYIIQWSGNSRVLRFDLEGNFVDEFTTISVPQSIGFDWDTDGNLYVSSWGQGTNGFVRKFDSSGNDLGIFIPSSSPKITGPTNICFMENGDLLVVDWSAGFVRLFDSEGEFKEDFISGLVRPEGIAFLPNGNILIGEGNQGNGRVSMFSNEGDFLELFATGNGLIVPNAVVLKEITPISTIDEVEKMEDFVYPTIGTNFFLAPEFSSNIKSIEIYNTSGLLVEKKEIKGDAIWNAAKYSSAYYFIMAIGVDGTIYRQKVLVQK